MIIEEFPQCLKINVLLKKSKKQTKLQYLLNKKLVFSKKENNNETYKLFAIVEHLGDSEDKGHYISKFLYEEKLYSINDLEKNIIIEQICSLDNYYISENPYIIFKKVRRQS